MVLIGVFLFQPIIIMKTGEKFHVEKENYDRLWQSFTERLEEGKNGTQAYPASAEQGKRAESLTPWYKKRGKKGFTTVTTNVCACSI